MALQRSIEKVNAQSCRTTNEFLAKFGEDMQGGMGKKLGCFYPDNSIGGAIMTENLNTQLCINYFTDVHEIWRRGAWEEREPLIFVLQCTHRWRYTKEFCLIFWVVKVSVTKSITREH